MSQPITFTVSDLIDQLQQFDPNAEVRLATQPSWPLEWSLSRSDPPSRSTSTASRLCTWVQGRQLGYLPHAARGELGW